MCQYRYQHFIAERYQYRIFIPACYQYREKVVLKTSEEQFQYAWKLLEPPGLNVCERYAHPSVSKLSEFNTLVHAPCFWSTLQPPYCSEILLFSTSLKAVSLSAPRRFAAQKTLSLISLFFPKLYICC